MAYKDKEKQREARRKYDKKRAGKRSRVWACIVYPESVSEDWMDRLSDQHVPALISPLHNMDVVVTGELKKPHYHVMVLWKSPTSEDVARAVFEEIGVMMPPELVRSAKGYARYLVHMDDHDKHRYDETDVKGLSGISWKEIALDEGEEVDYILMEIEDYVDENNIISFRQLCRYARYERPEWIHVLHTRTIFIATYVKSVAWEVEQNSN